jgi:spermidine/putrescine transport system ATP-binding protein
MTMADTVAVMNKGRIEQMGAPEELYELPKTVFVANFLGQSNLFTVDVDGGTDQVIHTVSPSGKISLPRRRSERDSGTITVGVRPEKLRLHQSAPAFDAAVNVIGPGRITDVSFIGVSTQYAVEVPGAGTVQVFAQNVEAGPAAKLGDEVWLSWFIEHTFGLADDHLETGAITADFSTQAIATQAGLAE